MFLVPTLRVRTIYEEIRTKVLDVYPDIRDNKENHGIVINPDNKNVLVLDWSSILNVMQSVLIEKNDTQLLSDLNQIIGLCNTIDQNAFLPIKDEDLSPSIGKYLTSYYDIVDKVVDELKKRNKTISTKGLIKTPRRYGYIRYFSIPDYGLGFTIRFDLWEKYADTPFWFFITESTDDGWKMTVSLKRRLDLVCSKHNLKILEGKSSNGFFVNMKPLLYSMEDEVINNFADRIETLLDELQTLSSQI